MTKMTGEQQEIDNDEISLKELIQKIQEWDSVFKNAVETHNWYCSIRRYYRICVCELSKT
jgi:hypothetical protein